MFKNRIKITTYIFIFLFFILGLLTLPHYGINWDTINHLPRGQAYLHYYLTKERDFTSLPSFKPYWQDPSTLLIRTDVGNSQISPKSLYQNTGINFDNLMFSDSGHPPLSDILSSVFNKVLFAKLRLINDIDSYRIYGIFLAALLVGLVFYWSSQFSGYWGGVVSALSLFLYPLFWSESHFNTQKDIPETVYWSFFMFAVYRGFTKNSWKWILAAALFCGLALGTKFNILFSVFIIIPWLVIYFFSTHKKVLFSVWIAFLFIPMIAFLILILTWPYLWQDIFSGLANLFGFYKGIGTTTAIGNIGSLLKLNYYPAKWIFFTTPVVTIFFLIIGILGVILKIKKDKNKLGWLFLLWLFVSIFRVTVGGSVVYGGIRQVMEYIPAIALLAGAGAGSLIEGLSSRIKLPHYLFGMMAILVFLPITIKLYKIHPNENVYFNWLVGGLKGAKNKDIPSWGNSFGAAYRQGVNWINKNAELNAKLVFAFELMPNIPSIWVRPDILFHNTKRSGFVRDGEYAITLTYDGTNERSYYDRYLETTLIPVYEVKVDDVSILKVWKNDIQHSRQEYKKLTNLNEVRYKVFPGRIDVDLKKLTSLAYIDISFKSNGYCKELSSGAVNLSTDYVNWNMARDFLPPRQITIFGKQPSEKRLVYSFLGERARYLRIEYLPKNSCLNNVINAKVHGIKDFNLTPSQDN